MVKLDWVSIPIVFEAQIWRQGRVDALVPDTWIQLGKDKTRQVSNLFQVLWEEFLGFFPKGFKRDLLKEFKNGAKCAAPSAPPNLSSKPLKTELVKFCQLSLLLGLISQVFGVKEFIFGVKKPKICVTPCSVFLCWLSYEEFFLTI